LIEDEEDILAVVWVVLEFVVELVVSCRPLSTRLWRWLMGVMIA